jgi:hypothetical protein
MRVTVEEGVVVEARSISGLQPLVAAATNSIMTWRFDKKVNASFDTTFVYRLKGRKETTSDESNPVLELRLPYFVKITAKHLEMPPGG